jgi:hypothetical protein
MHMTKSAETNDALEGTEPVVQTSARAPSIAADRDDGEPGLDAAAGCEFVDDRIRVLD